MLAQLIAGERPEEAATLVPGLIMEHRSLKKSLDGFVEVRRPVPPVLPHS